MKIKNYIFLQIVAVVLLLAGNVAFAIDVSQQHLLLFKQSVRKIYVNNSGTDSATCGKIANPCETMNHARQFIRPGKRDRMYLDGSSVFHEQYELVDKQYLGPYGTGRPKITGADPLANASFVKTDGYTNVYEYSLPSIPTTSNTYANLTNADVLMTWENNVRLGGRFQNNATSIATVDATPGRQWWDSSAKKLYIHTTDSTSPITNGRTYEASTRTLALHGGDDFYVEYIDAEKAYAVNSSGQQGYQLLGYKGGTYYKCSAKCSWNHNAGVANDVATSNELLFDHCLFEDMENISEVAPPGSLFVAYKANLATPARVTASHCVARQPARHATVQNKGFLSHGNSIYFTLDNPSVENLYYGVEKTKDDGVLSTFDVTGIITSINCYKGTYIGTPGNIEGWRAILSQAGDVALDIRCNGVTAENGHTIHIPDSLSVAVTTAGDCTDTPVISDSFFARSEASTSLGVTGVNGLAGHPIAAQSCVFYNIGNPMSCHILGSDYNTFYSFIRVVNNADDYVPPGYFSNFAAWQAASGQDLNSTAPGTAPTLPDGFWDIAIPDVLN